ncbi:prostate stem cell antigen-like [Sphaerodactylus townsendi]|uniref:prostate stem cell antigen-like n=1 Tax=Sphaerodactylus townsendi TaxID=933632 RepID=UPI002026E80F|nr:prostate stem cell antigen-like [Sphaerodactylus townsendi]
MKIQMNTILLLCVLVILFIEIVGGAVCHGCDSVRPDDSCAKQPFECTIDHLWQYCYIRKVAKLGTTVQIVKGCTSYCQAEYRVIKVFSFNTWCCTTDYCNSMRVLK